MGASKEGGRTSVRGGRRLDMANRVSKMRHVGGGEYMRDSVLSSVGRSLVEGSIGRCLVDKRGMSRRRKRKRRQRREFFQGFMLLTTVLTRRGRFPNPISGHKGHRR
ncbi:hypothetical protein LIER_26662 [Lithospermum erythrorhizon]|uniref:Uncharacterized protein n=1 Tax=Lithospermum erythrorhizon TaxID=34254 RepID=A0AAV3RC71_LITER